jgi:hypothetical protein
MLARFVVAVMTPTNHRTAHPWSAASETTTPRFMGIHGRVQQRVQVEPDHVIDLLHEQWVVGRL